MTDTNLTPEREQEIRETHPGSWYEGPWTQDYVDSDGDEPAYCRIVHHESGEVLATLPDFAGPIALFIADAHDAVPELLVELDRVRAERDRRRDRLVALQNDALDMRGALSPNGEDHKVPFELGETLTPAVDWLIGRVAELEAEVSRLVDDRGRWRSRYYEESRTYWDAELPPGGECCADCGQPVESEPCPDHHSATVSARLSARVAELEGDLDAGVKAAVRNALEGSAVRRALEPVERLALAFENTGEPEIGRQIRAAMESSITEQCEGQPRT